MGHGEHRVCPLSARPSAGGDPVVAAPDTAVGLYLTILVVATVTILCLELVRYVDAKYGLLAAVDL